MGSNQGFLFSVFEASHHSRSIDFHIVGTLIQGIWTNVYDPHTSPHKESFIDSIKKLIQRVGGRHWILGGDFNMITSLEENKGGKIILEGEHVLFQEAIEDIGLVDIVTGEDIYMWINRRGRERHIASILDRFLVSESFLDLGSELCCLVPPFVTYPEVKNNYLLFISEKTLC